MRYAIRPVDLRKVADWKRTAAKQTKRSASDIDAASFAGVLAFVEIERQGGVRDDDDREEIVGYALETVGASRDLLGLAAGLVEALS